MTALQQHSALGRVLAVAAAAALTAGDYFKARLAAAKQVKAKSSPADLVTDVDPVCERLIREQILARFPDHDILGEESTESGAEASARAAASRAGSPRLWIVDPLDGTTNFVHRLPLSTVSIAYSERGQVLVGVVYDPYHGEVFYGVRGQGARLAAGAAMRAWADSPGGDPPGERLRASATESLASCILATGFPTRAPSRTLATHAGFILSERVRSMRALGSAALHLAYVAAGRLDGFWEYDLNAWDLAAGVLLVEEAGGIVRGLADGRPYTLTMRDVVVSGHPRVADAIIEALQAIDGGGAAKGGGMANAHGV
ncbi:MAG: inositol monophosphatase [Alicyclobacillaceae bacterium]|nr:inositol monophosphatase [Alicyclobacillaceae bacterium]